MAKVQQPYFAHEASSRHSVKMAELRIAHGVTGYGVYYMLLERLRLAENYEEELHLKALEWDLDCPKSLIASVINDFELFDVYTKDDKVFFSSYELNEKMALMEEMRQRRSEAARKAAECRWSKKEGHKCPVATELAEMSEEGPDAPAGGCQGPGRGFPAHAPVPERAKTDDDDKGRVRLTGKGFIDLVRTMEGDFIGAVKENLGLTQHCMDIAIEKFLNHTAEVGKKGFFNDMTKYFKNFVNAMRRQDWFQKELRKSQGTPERLSQAETDRLKEKGFISRADRIKKEMEETQSTDNEFRNLGYEPRCVDPKQFTEEWRAANPPQHPEWIGHFPHHETLEDFALSQLDVMKSKDA